MINVTATILQLLFIIGVRCQRCAIHNGTRNGENFQLNFMKKNEKEMTESLLKSKQMLWELRKSWNISKIFRIRRYRSIDLTTVYRNSDRIPAKKKSVPKKRSTLKTAPKRRKIKVKITKKWRLRFITVSRNKSFYLIVSNRVVGFTGVNCRDLGVK